MIGEDPTSFADEAVPETGATPDYRLHHVGVATQKLAATTTLLESLFGYRTVSGPFTDPIQRVSVSFLTLSAGDAVELELVEPLTEDSPLRTILQKGGGTAYHLCLETADLDAALAHALRLKCLLVSPPAPAVAFNGRRIAWIYTPTRQLIELVEMASGVKETRPATVEPGR